MANESYRKASLIYLHGGNPIIQKQLYEDKGIYELLKHYEGLMLGASAGAMNMSRYITLTPTNEGVSRFRRQRSAPSSRCLHLSPLILPERVLSLHYDR